MDLSVIVPCYNCAATLGEQLDALARQSYRGEWEVILADNGCSDDSASVIESYRDRLPRLRVVDASDVRGAAHARNVGALAARSERLAFCDADDVVDDGWVAAMVEALSQEAFVASRWDIEKLNSADVRQTRRNGQATGLQQYTYPAYLPHAGGCGLGVRRQVHLAVGGFNETMRCLEDTDYCWRIQLGGTPMAFAADALIYIRYRQNVKASFKQAIQYGKSNVLLYKEYRSLGMPNLSWRSGVKAWINLLSHLDSLRDSHERMSWVRQVGWRLGRLLGSIQYRVMAL